MLLVINSEIGHPFRFTLPKGGELSISNETAGFTELRPQIRFRCDANFGPLTLAYDGCRHDGRQSVWSDMHNLYLRVTDGRETLTLETNSFLGLGVRIPPEKIPSGHVCLQLIEHLAPAHLLTKQG